MCLSVGFTNLHPCILRAVDSGSSTLLGAEHWKGWLCMLQAGVLGRAELLWCERVPREDPELEIRARETDH